MKTDRRSPGIELLPEPGPPGKIELRVVPLLQGVLGEGDKLLELDDLREIGERLRVLVAASEKPEDYALQIAPRFEHNLKFLQTMRKMTEVRDLVWLEIYQTQQWRARYQSLEEFVVAEAGVTRGTFHKSLDKAEIRLQLLAAGIEAFPKRRQYEQLAKVEKEHRVEAWKVALRFLAEADGGGERSVEYGLVQYCHDNGVIFGRMRFGRKMTELDLLAAKVKTAFFKPKNVENDGNWADRVAPEVVRAIADCMPASIRERAAASGGGDSCGTRFLVALQNMTHQQPQWNPEYERMYRALLHLKAVDPAIADALMRLAIGGLCNFVEGEVMLGIHKGHVPTRKAG